MNRRFSLACFALILFSPALCWAQGTPTPSQRKPLSSSKWKEKLEPGDIVFIRSRSDNALLIAALSGVVKADDDTDEVFTHCGIIFKDGEELKVYEGAGRGKFLTVAGWQIAESDGTVGKIVDGEVKRVPKKEPLHNVYAMRWKPETELKARLGDLLKRAEKLHKDPYDNGFSWSDNYEYTYCSELIWKAYAAAGFLLLKDLPTMAKYVKGASSEDAKKIVDKLDGAKGSKYRKDGYLPGESAISPEDIYKSPRLTPITDKSP